MAKWVVVAALLAAGCNQCESPSGFYESTFTEISGSCGLGSWTTVKNFDAPLMAGFSCSGDRHSDRAECTAYADLNCTDASTGATSKVTGAVDWDDDASHGHGRMTIVVELSGDTCTSTLDVRYTRL